MNTVELFCLGLIILGVLCIFGGIAINRVEFAIIGLFCFLLGIFSNGMYGVGRDSIRKEAIKHGVGHYEPHVDDDGHVTTEFVWNDAKK